MAGICCFEINKDYIHIFKFQDTLYLMKIAPFTAGGGVALYIRLGYSYSMRNDLKIGSIENLWIETNDTVVGVIYTTPNFSYRFFRQTRKNST